ncbi:hypothetical protein C2S51_002216 [Perilla frutescens var. frutescens]|nr:hypothetical protein C2S51_002216 [Perilla frutescens var. frutescens]
MAERKEDSEIKHSQQHLPAVKEGDEEPVSFGPNSTLVDYGSDWKLQTVIESNGDKGQVHVGAERVPKAYAQCANYKHIKIVQGQYYIDLEQIKIGDKKLNIDPRILRRNEDDYTGGLMLDTGSIYTFFPLLVVEEFIDEIYWLIGHLFHKNTAIRYRNYISRNLIDFPTVRLVFESGATMEVRPENVFRQFDNEIFCLAIVPSEYFMGLGSSEMLAI